MPSALVALVPGRHVALLFDFRIVLACTFASLFAKGSYCCGVVVATDIYIYRYVYLVQQGDDDH